MSLCLFQDVRSNLPIFYRQILLPPEFETQDMPIKPLMSFSVTSAEVIVQVKCCELRRDRFQEFNDQETTNYLIIYIILALNCIILFLAMPSPKQFLLTS
jgi:hypothetical protein